MMLLGLSLSVAVVVAIDLSVDSARSALSEARQALSGAATHQIVSDGGPVPAELLAQLRREGIRAIAPVIETEALYGDAGIRLRLLAIDPISEAQLRPWLTGSALAGNDSGTIDPRVALIADAEGALLSAALAQQLKLTAGMPMQVRIDGRAVDLVVRAVLDNAALPASSDNWVILDIAGGQRALADNGYTRIDLRLEADTAQQLGATLPLGLRLLATAEQDQSLALMSRAFEINLKALSLLALLVGLFVVFQTLSFLTLRRSAVIGLWRAIGVNRRLLASLLLGEAVIIGVLAALIGIGLGIGLGHLLLTGIDATYSQLYGRSASADLSLAPWLLAKALILSTGGAVLAVLLPLADVLGKSVLQAMGRSDANAAARDTRVLALPSLILFILGGTLLHLGPDDLITAFVALFMGLIGCLGLVPWLAHSLLMILEKQFAGASVLTLWLLAGSRRGLGRTGIALAALCLAIATVIGMSSMIHSFRSAVSSWIDQSLQADVYLSMRGRGALPPELLAVASAMPGVRHVSQTRRSQRLLSSGPVDVIGLALPDEGRDGFDWIEADSSRVWQQFAAGEALISEPMATRLQLRTGDQIELPGAAGSSAVRIAAIYRDYASSQGALTLALAHYQQRFTDTGIGAIGIYAKPSGVPGITSKLNALAEHQPGVQVVSAHEIRERTLTVFARTFAVTDQLRLLAGLIAMVAIVGALSALAVERQREFALLRSLGLSRRRLLGLQWLHASLLGLIAALLALPLGIGLAVLLIDVINRRSFGWSMPLQLPWAQLLLVMTVAIVSAMLAGTLPARQQARKSLAQQLRDAPL